MTTETAPQKVGTQEMARLLGISIRTLFHYQKTGQFFIEGRHFSRSTPSDRSPWLWDVEKTIAAWKAEVGS
jgi:hypothetical protein